jgi:deazaflavin-dependent oxidoreductase (nitroreductase family)
MPGLPHGPAPRRIPPSLPSQAYEGFSGSRGQTPASPPNGPVGRSMATKSARTIWTSAASIANSLRRQSSTVGGRSYVSLSYGSTNSFRRDRQEIIQVPGRAGLTPLSISESGRTKAMPLPRSVARFNRRATNRLLSPLVPYLPTFGFVIHTGRKTGRQYRTPVNAFRRAGGYMIGLPYGRESDWVLNVLAAGGCILEMHRRSLRLTRPRLIPARTGIQAMPAPLRVVGRLGLVSDFLDLYLDDGRGGPGRLS